MLTLLSRLGPLALLLACSGEAPDLPDRGAAPRGDLDAGVGVELEPVPPRARSSGDGGAPPEPVEDPLLDATVVHG